ncbi:MAG: hypothetical protein LIQ31_08645, partial [Planctomycetes bacterium]|nr:hypothetical protein [Planctomycetota bacterium]
LYDITDHDQHQALINAQIHPLKELRPDLPKGVVDVVTKALSYVPENRQANAEELLNDFRSALA